MSLPPIYKVRGIRAKAPENYEKKTFRGMKRLIIFPPKEIDHFIYTPKDSVMPSLDLIDENVLNIFKAQKEHCATYNSDMVAKAMKMNELHREVIKNEGIPYLERNIKMSVFEIRHLIRADKDSSEMLQCNLKKLPVIFQNCRDENQKKKEEQFETTNESYANELKRLLLLAAAHYQSSPLIQEFLKLKIEIAEIKTKSFFLWQRIKTVQLVIEGLDEIRINRRDRVWEEIIFEPIRRFNWDVLHYQDTIRTRQLCSNFNPHYMLTVPNRYSNKKIKTPSDSPTFPNPESQTPTSLNAHGSKLADIAIALKPEVTNTIPSLNTSSLLMNSLISGIYSTSTAMNSKQLMLPSVTPPLNVNFPRISEFPFVFPAFNVPTARVDPPTNILANSFGAIALSQFQTVLSAFSHLQHLAQFIPNAAMNANNNLLNLITPQPSPEQLLALLQCNVQDIETSNSVGPN